MSDNDSSIAPGADLTSASINTPEIDSLKQALADLEAVLNPIESNVFIEKDIEKNLAFMQMLWSSFYIFITEPFGGGKNVNNQSKAKIIALENGRNIFDYGFALSTSVGEDYTSYCQGRLYNTIEEMIAILAKRGVKEVSMIGNSAAMRFAWIECTERQIEIANFQPNSVDVLVRERVRALKDKAKKLMPGQELRL